MNEEFIIYGMFVGIGVMCCFLALAYFLFRLTIYYNRWLDNLETVCEVKYKLRIGLMQQIAQEENINLDSIVLTKKVKLKEQIRDSIL